MPPTKSIPPHSCIAPPSAPAPLRILLVEDSEIDAELVVCELRHGGYEPAWKRVDSAAALTTALDRQTWDVITCDWVMPQFSGPAALELLQQRQIDAPIIIVTGQVGEEYAVTAMKAGAHDFVSKNNLARLCPAITRELKDAQVRREHQQTGKALTAAHEQVRLLADNMLDMLAVVDLKAVFQYASPAHQRTLGYAPEELLGRCAFDFFHPEDVAPVRAAFEAGIRNRTPGRVQFRHRHADGHYLWLEALGKPLFDEHGAVVAVVVNGRDITDHKQLEDALRQRTHDLRERVKELNCLYSVAKLVRTPDLSSAKAFQGIVDRIPPACQFPGLTGARLTLEGQTFQTANFSETPWKLTSEIVVRGQPAGMLEVCYLQEGPARHEGPFLREEQSLLDALTEWISKVTERKRGEEALQESEERFRRIVETAAEGIWALDAQNRLTFVNERMAAMLGYSVAEMLGAPIFAFMDAEAQVVAQANVARRRQGISDRFDFRFRRKDGTPLWATVGAVPLSDQGGRYLGAFAMASDVTDRRKAEEAVRESERRFRLLVESSPDAIYVQTGGRIAYLNQAAVQLFGATKAEDLLGKSFLDRIHPECRAIVAQRARLLGDKRSSVPRLEETYLRLDGTPVPVEVSAVYIHFEGSDGALVFVRDITERKRTESRLQHHALQIEEANRLKDLFADILSHDLLNPVNVISGALQLLVERPDDPDRTELVRLAQHNARKMEETIKAANLYSRLNAAEFLERQEADLNTLFQAVAHDLQPLLAERHQQLDYRAPDTCPAVVSPIIESVFANLITNASKYSPPGQRIEATVTDHGDHYRLAVKDWGSGIHPDDRPKLFTRFQRLNKAGVKGTGLGLAIVKRIIDLHHGRVWVDDNLEGGAIFCVEIPKA